MSEPDQNTCVCGTDLAIFQGDLCDDCAWDLYQRGPEVDAL